MNKATGDLEYMDHVTFNNEVFGVLIREQGNYFEALLEDGTKIWITRKGREYKGSRKFQYCPDVQAAKQEHAEAEARQKAILAERIERRELARIEAENRYQARVEAFRKANPELKYEAIFTPTDNPADTFYKAEFINANGHKGFIFFQIVEGEDWAWGQMGKVKGFKLEQTVGVDFEYDRFHRSMPGGSRVFNTVEEAIENLIIDHYWD